MKMHDKKLALFYPRAARGVRRTKSEWVEEEEEIKETSSNILTKFALLISE